jgi:hypothetical protein
MDFGTSTEVCYGISCFFFFSLSFNGLNFPDIQLTHNAHPLLSSGHQVPSSSASGCVKFRLDLTMLSKVEYGATTTVETGKCL